MHHTRTYIGTQEEKDKKAMEDIRFYLGDELFEKTEKIIGCDKTISRKEFVFSLSFLGIQGYPCEAWARKLNITLV